MDKWGAHWFKFDEESGNVTDSKGSIEGTLYANATRVPGWDGNGKALNFNGTSTSYINFAEQVIPLGNYNITVLLKLDTKPTSENQEILSNAYLTASHRGLRIWLGTDGNITFASTNKTDNKYDFVLVSPVQYDGQWREYSFVWDADNKKVYMYIDKVLVAEGNSVTQNTEPYTYFLRVGNQRYSGVDRFFNGQMDELQIYNYAVKPDDFIRNSTLFLHDGEYKTCIAEVVDTGNTENLVPIMTSNTSPSGEAFGDSTSATAGFEFYKAFTRDLGDCWVSSTAKFPHHLGFDFKEQKTVSSYTLTTRDVNSNDLLVMCKDWTFEGSDDGIEWEILDTQRNQIWTDKSQTKEFKLKRPVTYSMFRVVPTSNNGFNTTQVSIGNFSMYHEFNLNYIWQTVSSALPSQQEFLNYGIEFLSPFFDRYKNGYSPLDDLDGEIEFLTLTDEVDGELALGIDALSKPQIIYQESDIVLTGIDTIDSVEFIGNENSKVAISFDSRVTWKAYKNGAWVTVANAHDGMTASEINALTKEQIAEARGNSQFVQFSYSLTDDAEGDNMEMVVSLQGEERILPSDAYELDYDSLNKTIIYTLKRDMTLSVNYVDA